MALHPPGDLTRRRGVRIRAVERSGARFGFWVCCSAESRQKTLYVRYESGAIKLSDFDPGPFRQVGPKRLQGRYLARERPPFPLWRCGWARGRLCLISAISGLRSCGEATVAGRRRRSGPSTPADSGRPVLSLEPARALRPSPSSAVGRPDKEKWRLLPPCSAIKFDQI